jgi:hypothetical protein
MANDDLPPHPPPPPPPPPKKKTLSEIRERWMERKFHFLVLIGFCHNSRALLLDTTGETPNCDVRTEGKQREEQNEELKTRLTERHSNAGGSSS